MAFRREAQLELPSTLAAIGDGSRAGSRPSCCAASASRTPAAVRPRASSTASIWRSSKANACFLLGPSGSGKTTLLSIIGCVLSADCGVVRILGHDVAGLSRDEAALLRRQHIGFVFQRLHLIRGLTAMENVAVPLTLSGWTPSDAARRANELLAHVDMTDKVDVQPHRLSVGQCQRVAFARALAADPDLILADEPTASLDAKTGHQALELLRRLTVNAGKTVIVVTHDPRILQFADRIVHMENGKLEERAPTDDVMMAVVSHHDQELATVR